MEIKTVNTTKGELKYYREWEISDGAIKMINPKTIDKYRKIRSSHPDSSNYAVFFAFSIDQFNEGYKTLVERGQINDGEKLLEGGGGLFGTKQGIEDFCNFYSNRDKAIPEECDPQEVYFYEYNNHECMIDWDGDTEAIKIILEIWGADVAKKIVRYNATMSIENMICKPIKIKGLYFIHNKEKIEPKRLWFSNTVSDITTKGQCHCMYDNLLYHVYTPDGSVYYNSELSGLSASYDGESIYNFYVE